VLLIALVGAFATSFPAVILVASLGQMADDLDSTQSVLSWVVTAPLLASSVLIPALGKLGDLHGHRKVFLLGFVGSTAFGVATAVAPGVGLLIAARTAAQVAGIATQPTSLALIMEVFPPEARGRAMGCWSFVVAGAPAMGLLVGGPLVDAIGWRSLFLVQAAMSLVPLALAYAVLRETRSRSPLRFDVPGAITLAVASGGALFALNRAGAWGAGHTAVPVSAVVALVAGVAFVRRQRAAPHPLVPLALVTSRTYGAPVVADFCIQAATMGSFVLVPLLLRDELGYSVADTVGVLLPLPLGMAVLAPVGGWLVTSLGERRSAVLGTVALALGAVLLAAGAAGDVVAVVAVGLGLVGVANGVARPSLATATANALHEGVFGVGVATARMLSQLGSAAGITVLVMLDEAASPEVALAGAVPFAVLSVVAAAGLTGDEVR
jgi:MFS family permease